MPDLVVASYNVHAGVDGYARAHDVVGACAKLDADVLVLQEVWKSDHEPVGAGALADSLGYDFVCFAPMARARMASPRMGRSGTWGPPAWVLRTSAVWVEPTGQSHTSKPPGRFASGEHGEVGLAVLSRRSVVSSETIGLGRLPRDSVTRFAIRVTVEVDGTEISVFGTHMSHLSQGSPVQFRRLAHHLPSTDKPAVVAGDMNLWGPVVLSLLPRWRRAVVGPTWPAGRPHSQIDHILVTRSLSIIDGEVMGVAGSDHRPVRARLALIEPHKSGARKYSRRHRLPADRFPTDTAFSDHRAETGSVNAETENFHSPSVVDTDDDGERADSGSTAKHATSGSGTYSGVPGESERGKGHP